MKKRTTVLSTYCVLLLMGATTVSLFAQTVIGGNDPHPSAMLDVQSDSKGVLFPRMNSMKRDQIQSPASGLMIFNTQTFCLEINLGTPATPLWEQIACGGIIAALNCNLATLTGVLMDNSPATGVSVTVPYTGGNGEAHQGQTVLSTGVMGLTATLSSGSFASGDGNLTYSITGRPVGVGTASFALSIGGQSCTLALNVIEFNNLMLDCPGAIRKGEMHPNFEVFANQVSVIIPYTGANGSAHSGQVVTSTGVEGYTATLAPGSFTSGDGTLTYAITGLATVAGTANFLIQIGGQSCNLDLSVRSCTAMVSAMETKIFDCYNLGAYNTRVDPFTPSWEIIGNYYQWGRNPTCFATDGNFGFTNPCGSGSFGASGPLGPTGSEANSGQITSRSNTDAPDGNWTNAPAAKGPEDPCPQGFRVPSKVQWQAVIANNTPGNVAGASWTNIASNYSSGKNFGPDLFLPATGFRSPGNFSLFFRGQNGYYRTSTTTTALALGNNTEVLLFGDSSISFDSDVLRRVGAASVRCIQDN
jgi:hypothetical protein